MNTLFEMMVRRKVPVLAGAVLMVLALIIAYQAAGMKEPKAVMAEKSTEAAVAEVDFWSGFRRSAAHNPPAALPELVFSDEHGAAKPLAGFQGRYVVMNFWALWCPPCLEELPSLLALRAAREGDDLAVLVVSVDHPEDAQERAIKFRPAGITPSETLYAQSRDVWQTLNLSVLPTTLILNREGKILYTLSGEAVWDSSSALAAIDWLIQTGQ